MRWRREHDDRGEREDASKEAASKDAALKREASEESAAPEGSAPNEGTNPPKESAPPKPSFSPTGGFPPKESAAPAESPTKNESAPPSESASGSVGAPTIEPMLEAERAAEIIRKDAQDWARNYMAESRKVADKLAEQRVRELSELSDVLMSRAREVAEQSNQLLSTLDEASRRLLDNAKIAARPRPEGSDSGDASKPRLEREPPQKAEEAPRIGPDVSEGARLLAIQMAVAGSSRDEVARRLREEFGIRDSRAILDESGL
jgi:hypothetical protein